MGIADEMKEMFNMSESRLRSHVGMKVTFWNASGLGDLELNRKKRYEMLRRSKMLLSMHCSYKEVAKRIERRREWNIAKLSVIRSNLDLFPAVKYSYSSRRPDKEEISLVVSDGVKVRFDGVVRSNNVRRDSVDAPGIAYKKRREIQ